jgi:hypothetical protein
MISTGTIRPFSLFFVTREANITTYICTYLSLYIPGVLVFIYLNKLVLVT